MAHTTNPYFTQGTASEQNLVQDLIIESLRIYGKEVFYIPRTLVSKDDVLGEDRLSQFKTAYPIEMYFENIDSFEGQGAFIQKFGLMMEQSATLVVARRRWDQFIGRYGQSILPNRPSEGDLIYFPLTKGLFEVKFVKHQDPFYQLGKLYVYKLQVELFQYASEKIDTGIPEIDAFESLKTFDTNTNRNGHGKVVSVSMFNNGYNYTVPPTISFVGSNGTGATAVAVLGTGTRVGEVISIEVTNGGTGYDIPPTVVISGNGSDATAEAFIETDLRASSSNFSENDVFKEFAADVIFSESNPFGEIIKTSTAVSYRADSTQVTVDNTQLTADNVG